MLGNELVELADDLDLSRFAFCMDFGNVHGGCGVDGAREDLDGARLKRRSDGQAAKRTQGTNGSRPAGIQTGSSHCGLPFRTRGHAYLFRSHRFRCDRHHTTRLLPRVVSYLNIGFLRVRNVQCQFPFTVLFDGRIRQSETWGPAKSIP